MNREGSRNESREKGGRQQLPGGSEHSPLCTMLQPPPQKAGARTAAALPRPPQTTCVRAATFMKE